MLGHVGGGVGEHAADHVGDLHVGAGRPLGDVFVASVGYAGGDDPLGVFLLVHGGTVASTTYTLKTVSTWRFVVAADAGLPCWSGATRLGPGGPSTLRRRIVTDCSPYALRRYGMMPESTPRSKGDPPMSYQPPAPQPPRRKGLSGGMIALIVVGAVVVCCVGTVGGLFVLGVFADTAQEEPTAQQDPTTEVVSCEIDGRTADVDWAVTNPNGQRESYRIEIVVEDGEGRQVGDATRRTGVDGGATVRDSTWLILDAEGGETCQVTAD